MKFRTTTRRGSPTQPRLPLRGSKTCKGSTDTVVHGSRSAQGNQLDQLCRPPNLFEFRLTNTDAYAVWVDERPVGSVLCSPYYRWLALDLDDNIVARNVPEREKAAAILWDL